MRRIIFLDTALVSGSSAGERWVASGTQNGKQTDSVAALGKLVGEQHDSPWNGSPSQLFKDLIDFRQRSRFHLATHFARGSHD
jgi:hypothetical protein